jgi:hypothetical protein
MRDLDQIQAISLLPTATGVQSGIYSRPTGPQSMLSHLLQVRMGLP